MISRAIPIFLLTVGFMLVSLATLACSSADPGSQTVSGEASESATLTVVEPERYVLQQPLDFTMTLTTTSIGGTFGRLDRKHTCEKGDISPHLKWEGVPDGAKSLALVMDDPASDVHGLEIDVLWTHWVVYSIPPEITELAVGQVSGELLENGAKQGANDYGKTQYNGPCPVPTLAFPSVSGGGRRQSREHMIAEDRPYYLEIYGLDVAIDLKPGVDRDTLMEKIDGHILAAGELIIPYKSVKRLACYTKNASPCVKSIVRWPQ